MLIKCTFDVILKENSSHEEQVHDLLEYLKSGTNRTYRGFLYALSETGQRRVVMDILGEEVPDLTASGLKAEVSFHIDSTCLRDNKAFYKVQMGPVTLQAELHFWQPPNKSWGAQTSVFLL